MKAWYNENNLIKGRQKQRTTLKSKPMKQKIIRLTSYSTITSLFGVLAAAGVALAIQSAPTPLVSNVDSLGEGLFCPIVNIMFWVLISIAIIMVMWAAYLYLTAGDDTEKVHRATKTITFAAIAVIVGILAKGFPTLIATVFGSGLNSPWQGGGC